MVFDSRGRALGIPIALDTQIWIWLQPVTAEGALAGHPADTHLWRSLQPVTAGGALAGYSADTHLWRSLQPPSKSTHTRI